jgi:hypothetical protein
MHVPLFSNSADVLVLTVRCKLINFAFQIFPLFIPEMSDGFTSYILQVRFLVHLLLSP